MVERAHADRPDVTALLAALDRGEAAAHDRLFTLVYDELKRMAAGHLRRSAGASINPTALLHEAWLRLANDTGAQIQDSRHFYNVVAQAMRQILIDLARRRATERHGAGFARTQLTDRIEQPDKPIEELLALDAALGGLRDCDADLAELVEWHSFVGLPLVEIARLRGVTERTVRRHWVIARAFLGDAMGRNASSMAP